MEEVGLGYLVQIFRVPQLSFIYEIFIDVYSYKGVYLCWNTFTEILIAERASLRMFFFILVSPVIFFLFPKISVFIYIYMSLGSENFMFL